MRYPFIGNFPITREFGVYDPAYANYPESKHSGTDYGVPFRYPYVAAMNGVVSIFPRGNTATGRGNEVRIVDGSTEVRYCHLDEIYVKNGQRVEQGQQIGTCGWTGYVIPKSQAGAHLHFELLLSGVYTDFEKYMKGGSMDAATRQDVTDIYQVVIGRDPVESEYAWVNQPHMVIINALRNDANQQRATANQTIIDLQKQVAAGSGEFVETKVYIKKG